MFEYRTIGYRYAKYEEIGDKVTEETKAGWILHSVAHTGVPAVIIITMQREKPGEFLRKLHEVQAERGKEAAKQKAEWRALPWWKKLRTRKPR